MTLSVILLMAAFCASAVYSAGSADKARQILEKTSEKYSVLLNENDEGIKSIAAKISIKGGGQVPMGGGGGSMPLDVDMAIEIYFSRPKNLYLGISGSLGNAVIVASGTEKVVTTIILPSMKQFAVIDMPEDIAEKTQKYNPQEPNNEIEKMWDEAILVYDGMQNMKAGKAHKITIKAKDPMEEGSATVYILDGTWDPVGIEIKDPEKGALVIEFEQLELNTKISKSQFVPDTKGYTKIKSEDLLGAVMMQVMGAMMQSGGIE